MIASPGLRLSKSDPYGGSDESGTWLPPVGELADESGRKAYAWTHESELRGNVWTNFYFKVRPERPGNYRVRVKVSASQLYKSLEATETLRVRERHAETQSDTVADCRSRCRRGGTGHYGVLYGGWALEALTALDTMPAVPDACKTAMRSVPRFAGSREGADYFADLLDQRVRTLYDVRRRLSHRRAS